MKVYWLWLSQKLSARGVQELMAQFSSPEEVYFASARDFARLGLGERTTQALCDKELGDVNRLLEQCEQKDIRVLTLSDAAYPEKLKAISDPPPVLYLRGALPPLETQPCVGVVGTRKASAYGLQTAMRLSWQLTRGGAIVVTGLAHGVDSEAARGALLGDGPVVGVLGTGVDVVYPRENRTLYADVAARGCLLSEFPPGTPPLRWNFPTRNRILSGLCDGVLVVEAGDKSGALITARLALEQGRDVFAVPGTLDNPVGRGSNELLRQGAGLITCGWDLLQEYENRYPGKLREVSELPPEPKPPEPLPPVSKPPKPPSTEGLRPEEQAIVQALAPGRLQLDDLIAASALPAGRVLSALTMLQIKGVIEQLPGKWYQLS